VKKAVLAALVATLALAIGATTARADTFVFLNGTAINVPDSAKASPYPSAISVSGLTGGIQQVTVNLIGINHGNGSDLDVLLVGPHGQKALLMSDVCSGALTSLNLGFRDGAVAGALPASACVPNTYIPTDASGCADTFPSPAPAGPYGTALSAFNGTDANGAWNLFVVDSCPGASGAISGGWALTLDGPQSIPNPAAKKKKCKKKSGKKSADSKSKKKKKCKKKKKKK
jgi:subtilisin-like proprotein convertase family protein